MNDEVRPGLYALAQSERTMEMIRNARSELSERREWKERQECIERHSRDIIERLWRGAGLPPQATRPELEQLVTDCISSEFLREDRAGAWLVAELGRLTRYSAPIRALPLSVKEAGITSDEYYSAVTEPLLERGAWEVRITRMLDGPWAYSDPILWLTSSALSRQSSEQFAVELQRISQTMWAAMHDSYEGAEMPFSAQGMKATTESLRRLIELWLVPPPKRDPLRRRLRNAILLMTEAKHARHSAVSLALWCAAVEALVVQGKSEIGDTLASNVATLLQPTPDLRLEAIQRVKRLYGRRSDLIHGTSVDEQPALAEQAGRLAAGALAAVMQWMRHHDRIDAEALPEQQFFEAMRKAFTGGKSIEGVSPGLASCLPTEQDDGR